MRQRNDAWPKSNLLGMPGHRNNHVAGRRNDAKVLLCGYLLLHCVRYSGALTPMKILPTVLAPLAFCSCDNCFGKGAGPFGLLRHSRVPS